MGVKCDIELRKLRSNKEGLELASMAWKIKSEKKKKTHFLKRNKIHTLIPCVLYAQALPLR